MPTLIYRINAGVPNFTAHIEPNVAADQTHTSVGVYSFSNIPAGSYEVTVTDGMGCFVTVNQEFTTTTTTTTVTTTTSTTTTTTTLPPVTTTTTTTLPPVTTTTTTQAPINYQLHMCVNNSSYDFGNEVGIPYQLGTQNLNSPTKSGFNYLFISIPKNLNFVIRDSMNTDITSLFSNVGDDNRVGYADNYIWKKTQIFNSSSAVPFSLTLS